MSLTFRISLKLIVMFASGNTLFLDKSTHAIIYGFGLRNLLPIKVIEDALKEVACVTLTRKTSDPFTKPLQVDFRLLKLLFYVPATIFPPQNIVVLPVEWLIHGAEWENFQS